MEHQAFLENVFGVPPEELEGERWEFDPQNIVFDDPDDVWIYICWDEAVLGMAAEGQVKIADLRLPDGRYPIKLPARYRDIFVSEGLAPAELLTGIQDEALEPGYVTVLLTAKDLGNLIEAITLKCFESWNQLLVRQLRRLAWYPREIYRQLSKIEKWKNDE